MLHAARAYTRCVKQIGRTHCTFPAHRWRRGLAYPARFAARSMALSWVRRFLLSSGTRRASRPCPSHRLCTRKRSTQVTLVRTSRRPVEHVKGVEKDKCKIYARLGVYRLVVWTDYYATKHSFIQAGRIIKSCQSWCAVTHMPG